MSEPHTEPEASHTQRTMELLHALNAAAVSLQRSAHSESAVYRAFREQITRLGLRGSISLLDETGKCLAVRVVATPGQLLAPIERLTGLEVEGFEFEVAAVDGYRQVIKDKVAVYVPDSSEIMGQMLPERVRPLAGHILSSLGTPAAIYSPLLFEGQIRGVLHVAGAGLSQQDIPAMNAFAHNLGVALDNARLFAALQQTEMQYRLLFEMANDAILVIDPATARILSVNRKTVEMTGYSEAELLAMQVTDLHPAMTSEQAIRHFETIGDRDQRMLELPLRRRDGQNLIVQVSATMFKANHQSMIQSVMRDITERVQAEETLHKKTRQQEQLFETARHLTASLDVKEVLTQIAIGAREIERAYGCTIYLLEADGRTLTPVIAIEPPYEAEILTTPLDVESSFTGQAVRTGKALIFNDASVNDTGHRIPGTSAEEDERVIVAPLIANDRVLGAMCINRLGEFFTEEDLALAETFATYAATALKNAQTHSDLQHEVEERIRAEQELRESEEKYRNLVETMSEGIGVTDENYVFIYVNTAFMDMLGYSREEMIGHNLTEFVAEDYQATIAEQISQRKAGQTVQYELVWVSKNGQHVTTLISPSGIFDSDGRFRGSFGVLTDITEYKHMEEQLRQSQKMEAVGLLAGGIAHDFNNLLTAINGFAELMRCELKPEEPLYELAGKILNSGRRAAELVRQLLAFSRKQILEPHVLDLNRVVSRLEEMLRRVISEDIQLEMLPAPDLWPVQVDPTQIEQVIINLVINARDAMPTGGKLTIETANLALDQEAISQQQLEAEPGEYVRLTVRDTGTGMSEAVQAHIFEPFFTTKEVGQGTGLGLATVYGIVKQSGGHIHFHSQTGQGTAFMIYLPRAEAKAAHSSVSNSFSQLPRGTETVLIVEDNPDVRELMIRSLRPQGYTVLQAMDGVEALQVAEAHPGDIHLLLTDVVMPHMSGSKLAERLKAIRPRTKTLFTTGYADDDIVHYGVLHLDIPLLQKPFTSQALIRKVREVLDGG
jgi:two-component system cell cycle sensor histidine kinase/response regulator CckA